MSHYAIGDIQGCRAEFRQLLDLIRFSENSDRLWITGDLVNRGPDSLPVLRDVKALGDAVVTVLGNHDLHLLTVAAGHTRSHRQDTIAPILEAPDRDELLHWLARRPLVVAEGDKLLVHAGLLPDWAAAKAVALSAEVEAMLASARADAFLSVLYGDEPNRWDDGLEGFDRLRAVVNACTRMRFCTADGVMEFKEKRGPRLAPAGLSSVVRARATKIGRRHDHLRPLVDARVAARAERADARLRLPLGRDADGDQARGPPRVSGARPRAGDAKAVRIASSAARDKSRRCAPAAGNAGIT
jgi:bis(5'-nucleosyl)-tetraphosphatase (symmetrical)